MSDTTWNETLIAPPSSAPAAKTQAQHVAWAYGQVFNPYGRAQYVAQSGDPNLIQIAPNGGCPSGDGMNYSTILPFETTQTRDSYNLSIGGSPGETGAWRTPNDLVTQANGRTNYTVTGLVTPKGSTPRKLPYYSAGKIYAGLGIQGGNGTTGVGSPPAYGTFAIPDPNNPGSYIAAPGGGTTPDSVVSGAEIQVELATVGGVNKSYLKFGGDDGNGLMVDTAALPGGGGGSGNGRLVLLAESTAVGSFTETGNWLGNQNSGATAPPFTGATPGGGVNILDGFIDLSTVDFDPQSMFDTTTSTITIPTGGGGWYQIAVLSTVEFDPRNTESGAHSNGLSYFVEIFDTVGGSNAGAQISEEYIWGGYTGATIPSAGTDEINLQYARPLQVADGDTIQMQVSCGCNAGNIKIDKTYLALYRIDTSSGAVTGHQAKAHAATAGNSNATGNWLGDNNTTMGAGTTDATSVNYLGTLDWDTDGYWDSTNKYFVIPTGLGGTYLLTMKVNLALVPDTGSGLKDWTATLTDFNAAIHEHDTFSANSDSNGSGNFTSGANATTLTFTRTAQLNDGDQVIPQLDIGAAWHMTSDYADCALVKLS